MVPSTKQKRAREPRVRRGKFCAKKTIVLADPVVKAITGRFIWGGPYEKKC